MAVSRGPQERKGDTDPPGFGAPRTRGSVHPCRSADRSPKREKAGNALSRAACAGQQDGSAARGHAAFRDVRQNAAKGLIQKEDGNAESLVCLIPLMRAWCVDR